jgi:hypothetical protein
MNPEQPGAPLPPPTMPPVPPQPPVTGQPQVPPATPQGPAPLPHNPYAPDDPYRFIMEPPKRAKPKAAGIGGNPFIMKLVFFLGAAVVVMIAAAVVVNVFFGSKTNVQDIIDIAAAEQELIRISGKGADASDQSVKNAAVNTQATLTTEQQEWVTYLAKLGKKASPKQLALKKNTATDTQLTQALATSTFDLKFSQVMRSELQDYASQLKTTYSRATGKQEKALLEKHYKHVALLLEQWPNKVDPNTTPTTVQDTTTDNTATDSTAQ